MKYDTATITLLDSEEELKGLKTVCEQQVEAVLNLSGLVLAASKQVRNFIDRRQKDDASKVKKEEKAKTKEQGQEP